jgi:hypothetical protein
MYGILPEVPQPAVTAALRSFRLAVNSLPESVHDWSFQPATKRMLDGARSRLAAEGYDLARGLRGLRDPRRWPTDIAARESRDGTVQKSRDGAVQEPWDGTVQEPRDGAVQEPRDGAA